MSYRIPRGAQIRIVTADGQQPVRRYLYFDKLHRNNISCVLQVTATIGQNNRVNISNERFIFSSCVVSIAYVFASGMLHRKRDCAARHVLCLHKTMYCLPSLFKNLFGLFNFSSRSYFQLTPVQIARHLQQAFEVEQSKEAEKKKALEIQAAEAAKKQTVGVCFLFIISFVLRKYIAYLLLCLSFLFTIIAITAFGCRGQAIVIE
jgi:hypothetical protein